MEALFSGTAVDVSVPGVLWAGDFRPVEQLPPPVRHAAGYGLFVLQVKSSGTDPAELAEDAGLLARYLHQHSSALRAGGSALLDSAGMFLGNCLIARVIDARWQRIPPGGLEVMQGDGGGVEVLNMARAIVDAEDGHLPEYDAFLRQWDEQAGHDRELAEAHRAAERRLELREVGLLPTEPFVQPEHASLPDVAHALVNYLTTHYRATAIRTPVLSDDPSTTLSPTIETIRVTPQAIDAAPLVIAIDDVGAVAVRAGAFNELYFYGRDAELLEDALISIAAGLYREVHPPKPGGVGGYRLGSVRSRGTSRALGPLTVDPVRHEVIAAQLDGLRAGWAAWSLRI